MIHVLSIEIALVLEVVEVLEVGGVVTSDSSDT